MNRRTLIKTGAVLAGASVLPMGCISTQTNLKLGFDNFSIRALKWKAPQLLKYAAKQNVDTILLSDLDVYESHDESYLLEVKALADELEIEIQTGTGGICPTSQSFKKTHGTAEEHLLLAMRIAKTLGSNVVRCYLGSHRDRKTAGGLKPHIESTIATCKKVRSQALEAGIKIAIENHAGDMAAYQLRELIEKAGADFVAATIDSGNATWTLEDPLRNLKILAPYAVSSGIRDSMLWDDGNGINAQWTAMGEGVNNWQEYFSTWGKLCPDTPVQMEIISGGRKHFPHSDKDFWKNYSDIRESDLAAYKKLATKGKAIDKPTYDSAQKFQLAELEKSLKYSKEILGLGIKAQVLS